MKKTLLATTALVAFAGAAAADVELSGSAEMGIVGGGEDNIGETSEDLGNTQFFQDVDITFTLSGETDGGLSFGAAVDLDEAGNLGAEDDDQGVAIFISGGFGTVTMGDTDGALDWAVTETTGNPGSIDDAETLHAGYLGSFGDGLGDGQIVRYDNTFGAFGVALSVELDDIDDGEDPTIAIGGKYDLDLGGTTIALGGGFQQGTVKTADGTDDGFAPGNLPDYIGEFAPGTDVDIIGVSASASFGGGFSAGLAYSDWNFEDDFGLDAGASQTQLSVAYANGPISVGFNYGVYQFDDELLPDDVSGFGLAAAYDLGGGAAVHFAYSDSDLGDNVVGDPDYSMFSLGIAMSF